MTRRHWLGWTAGAVGVIAVSAVINPVPRVMWNATASVPTGFYSIVPTADVKVGDLVAIEPPEPLADYLDEGGYLPRGVPLLKHVTALPGSKVCRAGGAVTVDGKLVGEARQTDRRGRPLPIWIGCRSIVDGELFLMNTASPDSLDGRYFGPLPASAILGRASPLWTDPPRRQSAAAD
jgi:conjugative transfer signal peptidase TraF